MVIILKDRHGFSLIELVVTITILTILAAAIMPLRGMTAQRTREIELRRNLRVIRIALDDFKKSFDKMPAGPLKTGTGCPKSLKVLVDGYDFGEITGGTKKFLRRIPRDPFNPYRGDEEEKMWGLRSYGDKADSTTWGGDDVYDVYSLSEGTAIDGTKYKEW